MSISPYWSSDRTLEYLGYPFGNKDTHRILKRFADVGLLKRYPRGRAYVMKAEQVKRLADRIDQGLEYAPKLTTK